jgi:hypothetical protein
LEGIGAVGGRWAWSGPIKAQQAWAHCCSRLAGSLNTLSELLGQYPSASFLHVTSHACPSPYLLGWPPTQYTSLRPASSPLSRIRVPCSGSCGMGGWCTTTPTCVERRPRPIIAAALRYWLRPRCQARERGSRISAMLTLSFAKHLALVFSCRSAEPQSAIILILPHTLPRKEHIFRFDRQIMFLIAILSTHFLSLHQFNKHIISS